MGGSEKTRFAAAISGRRWRTAAGAASNQACPELDLLRAQRLGGPISFVMLGKLLEQYLGSNSTDFLDRLLDDSN
jgi:hypothetical protein